MGVLALLFPSVHFSCFNNGYWLCSESRKNDWRICQSSIQIALSRSIFELGSWFKSKMEVLALLFPSVHVLCFLAGYWLCNESRKNDWRICQSFSSTCSTQPVYRVATNSSISVNIRARKLVQRAKWKCSRCSFHRCTSCALTMDIGCAVSRAKMTDVYVSHFLVHVLHSVQGCNK